MRYLSESCPEMRDPRRYPTKRVEDAKGTFHWSLHTRSHWEEKKKTDASQQQFQNVAFYQAAGQDEQVSPRKVLTSVTMLDW